MNCEIFMVSYWKDAPFLDYALRSIEKYASGFSGVTVMAPTRDREIISPLVARHAGYRLVEFDEAPGKGFLHHEAIVCSADLYVPPTTDIICHLDSDCVFVEPASPYDYIDNEKPILTFYPFDDLAQLGPPHSVATNWRPCIINALGFDCPYDFMRRHPAMHWTKIYAPFRAAVERQVGRRFFDYVLSCKNDFPQTFAEFPSLGAWVWKHYADDYRFIDASKITWICNKLLLFWSHGGIEYRLEQERTPPQCWDRLKGMNYKQASETVLSW